MIVSHIVAVNQTSSIGKNNALMWHCPADLAYFKRLTEGHHILMGSKTFQSIGKPLPNRSNWVMSRHAKHWPKVTTQWDLDSTIHLMKRAAEAEGTHEIFIIGGSQLYDQTFKYVDRIYLTDIFNNEVGDSFYRVPHNFKKEVLSSKLSSGDTEYQLLLYTR